MYVSKAGTETKNFLCWEMSVYSSFLRQPTYQELRVIVTEQLTGCFCSNFGVGRAATQDANSSIVYHLISVDISDTVETHHAPEPCYLLC